MVAEAREDHVLSLFSIPEFATFMESCRTQVAVIDQCMLGREIQKLVRVLGSDVEGGADERQVRAPKTGVEVQSRIHLAFVSSQAKDQVIVGRVWT